MYSESTLDWPFAEHARPKLRKLFQSWLSPGPFPCRHVMPTLHVCAAYGSSRSLKDMGVAMGPATASRPCHRTGRPRPGASISRSGRYDQEWGISELTDAFRRDADGDGERTLEGLLD